MASISKEMHFLRTIAHCDLERTKPVIELTVVYIHVANKLLALTSECIF